MGRHPYANESYFAAKPVIDSGGQFIGDVHHQQDERTSLARTFMSGEGEGQHILSVILSYNVRPGRDEKWYEASLRN